MDHSSLSGTLADARPHSSVYSLVCAWSEYHHHVVLYIVTQILNVYHTCLPYTDYCTYFYRHKIGNEKIVKSQTAVLLLQYLTGEISFRCTNGDFYEALGSSMVLALLVWVGGGLLKRVLYFFR